ncbi:hypothetical protein [Kiritimatiella glycovorans]|uniref:Uncharacterized protein n=1 Tax=Kiritimatiella glycovorans TaxID=1307763 RepID=A0A0G3EJN8_9BACT|nr:hypothetical protein [Kiritimatiella glycovorans]AKJ65662.1 hypothetical protein L21SP4_02437 [Kiritimatiella glycovorans]
MSDRTEENHGSDQGGPSFRLRESGGPVSGKSCPHCNAPMGGQDVICMECGYNTQTGEIIRTTTSRRRGPRLGVWLLLFLLVAVVWIGFRRPEWIEPGRRAFVATYRWAREAVNPVPEVSGEDPVAPEPASSADRAEPDDRAAGSRRAEIQDRLNRKYPPLVPGESATFELDDGTTFRGEFRGLEGDQAVIKREDGRLVRGPLNRLSRETRLRCDPQARAQWVEERVR